MKILFRIFFVMVVMLVSGLNASKDGEGGIPAIDAFSPLSVWAQNPDRVRL